MVHNDAWSLPLPILQSLSPETASRCSSVCLSSAIALVKKHCIPFCRALRQIRGGSEPRRPNGAHFPGNEVLRDLMCHSEAGWPSSGSCLTLTGLRAARRGWVELEPRGLTGL